MNTNPKALSVLCYGDSNTYGQKPDKSGRFAADERWTGLLQQSLGDGYYIIEEGLSSRTTDLDYPPRPGRNGKTYLVPCLDSHKPLDVIIVMLGTNDLKILFNRSASDVAAALKGLVEIIHEKTATAAGSRAMVIIVSPILIDDTAPSFADFYPGNYDSEAAVKSKALSAEIKRVAEDMDCVFVDAASVASPGEDGLHIDSEGHKRLAGLLSKTVLSVS